MSVPKVVAVVGLLVLGVVALPVLATFLDGQGTENLILPADVVVMAVIGALVWRFLPAPAPAGAHSGQEPVAGGVRTLLVGAAVGVGAAVVGLLVFFLLLSGFSGA